MAHRHGNDPAPRSAKRAAQIKSEIQASLTTAVERQGGEAAQAAYQGKHANRRHQQVARMSAAICGGCPRMSLRSSGLRLLQALSPVISNIESAPQMLERPVKP
jgi:hypothetical protein